MDYGKLGERVRKQRILNQLTQAQLAEKVGVSTSFIGHIERGEKKASTETIVALCNAMEITPTVLLTVRVLPFSASSSPACSRSADNPGTYRYAVPKNRVKSWLLAEKNG